MTIDTTTRQRRGTPARPARERQRLARTRMARAVLAVSAQALACGAAMAATAQEATPATSPRLMAQAAAAATPDTPGGAVLPEVKARATVPVQGKDSVRARTTTIGKGEQALRDVPQSMTVLTERLIDDRNLDTLKDALRTTGGIAFQAAEGGEEDIRLRGFSLQASGDIFIDGMRDPAFYERDSFDWDRLEVLRGSASMLFGRGSTGGAVNQVTKQPYLMNQHEVSGTIGSGGFARATGDFNFVTGQDAALRINLMGNVGELGGVKTDKRGAALALRWGIGQVDEFGVRAYVLRNDNGIDYGLPWLQKGPSGKGDYLWPVDPGRYYGMDSDRNVTGTSQLGASHVHRFGQGRQVKTQLRVARYDRDQRASAIRFAAANLQPDGQAVTADTFGPDTVLNRGTNNKTMQLKTLVAQTDYTGQHQAWGMKHDIAAGADVSIERFTNDVPTLPTGVTLTKPRTTVGTPEDGAWIDESLRVDQRTREFRSRALGVYAQDMAEFAPGWKLLAGLRADNFQGKYHTVTAQGAATVNVPNPNGAGTVTIPNPCRVEADTRLERSDTTFSKRFGLLWQPTQQQSYHVSYGTSFNTSGDTYQFDAGTANVGPESSRNIELGGQLDGFDGRLTTRFAVFHSTKYNERNRDADSVNACNYVLSGQRHAAGLEVEVAGRITPAWEMFVSASWIPVAKVDASSGAAGTEAVGSRPGLTPKYSGSVWTTYRFASDWRAGLGLNVRSKDKPAGSTIEAPGFITYDAMIEKSFEDLTLKASVANITNEHVADYLYRGHYVSGKPRNFQVTGTWRFH